MKITPLKNKVLLRIPSTQERRVGSIIIPSTVSMGEKYLVGQVIEIGEGKEFPDGTKFPMELCVGDKVVVGKFAGTRLNIDDKLHMIVEVSEIMAVFSENIEI